MKKNKTEKPDKKKVCLELPKKLLKEINLKLVETYGGSFGHFGKTVEEGLNLWLNNQTGEFPNVHKKQFAGLTYLSPIETERGLRDQRVWHPETIEILGLEILNEPYRIKKRLQKER